MTWKTCAGCGQPMKATHDFVEIGGEGYRWVFHDVMCWDAHEITGALLPFLPDLRLASEGWMRETGQSTYLRATHAAVIPANL